MRARRQISSYALALAGPSVLQAVQLNCVVPNDGHRRGSGTRRELRFTAFQAATPAWIGQPLNAPLTLSLAMVNAQGGVGRLLATPSFTGVGWSPCNDMMTPGVAVTVGATYAVIASSTATQGCYAVAGSSADPYPGGHAATSADGGATFTPAASTDLTFLTTVS